MMPGTSASLSGRQYFEGNAFVGSNRAKLENLLVRFCFFVRIWILWTEVWYDRKFFLIFVLYEQWLCLWFTLVNEFLPSSLTFLVDGSSTQISSVHEEAWRGAEAFHYYMLAHRYLYSGKLHDAVCVAYKLQDYEQFIPASDIYSLLTLTSYLDKAFGICSRALMKLKSLEVQV